MIALRKPTAQELLFLLAGFLLALTLSFVLRVFAPTDLDIRPERILETFALRPDELPDGVFPVRDEEILRQAGLKRNPSFITRDADRKLQVQLNAFGGFLGLYGTEEEVLLLLKGYFFPDKKASQRYLDVQEGQRRKVNAYELTTSGGNWLLFLATDPEREYSPVEIEGLRQGLDRFQARLNATSRFKQIGNTAP